jgi:hypothetical protein
MVLERRTSGVARGENGVGIQVWGWLVGRAEGRPASSRSMACGWSNSRFII